MATLNIIRNARKRWKSKFWTLLKIALQQDVRGTIFWTVSKMVYKEIVRKRIIWTLIKMALVLYIRGTNKFWTLKNPVRYVIG